MQYPWAPMSGRSSESMSEETFAMPRVSRQEYRKAMHAWLPSLE